VSDNQWAIFLNGSYGVGKSSTLDHIGDRLANSGQPFSLMDVDWFHRSWPPATIDTGNKLIEAANMAAVWENYQKAGPRQLVISGVIASADDLDRYCSALRLQIRPVRLVATATVTEQRLRSRYRPSQESTLRWHLERHEELTDRLAAANLDELVIDTDELTPSAVAQHALTHFRL
jgi:hypothetical protein